MDKTPEHGREQCRGSGEACALPGGDLRSRRRISGEMRREIRDFIETGKPGEAWELYEGAKKRVYDSQVRMERRENDSLTGLPAQVYTRS